jgi:hypothetical protein
MKRSVNHHRRPSKPPFARLSLAYKNVNSKSTGNDAPCLEFEGQEGSSNGDYQILSDILGDECRCANGLEKQISEDGQEALRHDRRTTSGSSTDGCVKTPTSEDEEPRSGGGVRYEFTEDTMSLVSLDTYPLSQFISISPLDTTVSFFYYPFLETDFLSQTSQESIGYFEMRKVLHLPTPTILHEFIQEYFLHVHPTLPMLDEEAFWNIYRSANPYAAAKRRIPLFVLRTMLFAACSVSINLRII